MVCYRCSIGKLTQNLQVGNFKWNTIFLDVRKKLKSIFFPKSIKAEFSYLLWIISNNNLVANLLLYNFKTNPTTAFCKNYFIKNAPLFFIWNNYTYSVSRIWKDTIWILKTVRDTVSCLYVFIFLLCLFLNFIFMF